MELSLNAPFDGTVTAVGATAGEQVALGARLFVVEPSRRRASPGGAAAESSLPDRVTIYEVGPRDGLQNEQALVPVEVKEEFVRRLAGRRAAGRRGDQLRAPEVGAPARRRRGADGSPCGEDRAGTARCWCPTSAASTAPSSSGVRHVAIFGSATETFAQKNLNRSLDEQFAMFEPTVRRARAAGLDVRAYVSMCFGDPWEGDVPVEQVVDVGKRLFDLGASQLSLGDTIGVGTAGQVTALVAAFADGRHAAPTSWRCTSTTPTARRSPTPTRRLEAGITTYDASAGGLGGCPYAKSATGNLATEDLVWMLTGLGIEHGVDLDALVGHQRVDGRAPRPAQPVGRGACSRRWHESADHEPRPVVPPHRRAEDRHDVPAGPARPSTPRRWPSTTCTSRRARRWSARRSSTSAPRSTCSARTGAARPATPTGSWDALVKRVRRASGTVVVSHEILAPAPARRRSRG